MARLKALEAIAGGITGKSAPPIAEGAISKIFNDLNLLDDDLFSDVLSIRITRSRLFKASILLNQKESRYKHNPVKHLRSIECICIFYVSVAVTNK